MFRHRYLPMTEQNKKDMLKSIGVQSIDELFADIPEKVRFKGEYNIKKATSESALLTELTTMAEKNADLKQYISFLGAGVYDHYIPSVVDSIISRSEFYTAYTPYQAEISQGELQAIFEFQTMICELTGMDVANSSMYDGGTALAEAAMLSCSHTRRKKILVAKTVHPQSREVLKTYANGRSFEVIEIPHKNGIIHMDALKEHLTDNVAAVIAQYPNFFGRIEPLKEIEPLIHERGALFIVSSNPLSLGILTPPGKLNADIVVGDTQVFGIPASLGGPHCGYFATTDKLMRKMPGRLVGQTTDEEGKRGFVLTLQAREQHIRRDKATSNICSNQALNALATSVTVAALGKKGVREIAVQNVQKAHYAKKRFKEKGFSIPFDGPHFNEFVVELSEPFPVINDRLLSQGMISGYDLERDDPDLEGYMLIAVTELRTKEEIDRLVTAMEGSA